MASLLVNEALCAAFSSKAPLWFSAVGMKYRGNYIFKRTDKVSLVLENDNPYDKNAIKVVVGGKHVAYVCRDDTLRVREAMSAGIGEIQFDKYSMSGRSAYFNIF